jgi:predicted molibdopterin-dependent oxidoreductase YjgC
MGCGTRTAASDRIADFDAECAVRISPQAGSELQLDLPDGQTLQIMSTCGSIRRPFKIDKNMTGNQIFVPLAHRGNDAVNLLDLSDLSKAEETGWKICRVNIEKSSNS